jgi:hypothetical protein
MHELTINKKINKWIKLSVYIYKTCVQINAFDWPRSLFHLPGPRSWSSFWALPKSRHGLLLLRVSLCGSATARICLCGLLGDRLHWLQAFWLPLFQVFTSENYCMFCVCFFWGVWFQLFLCFPSSNGSRCQLTQNLFQWVENRIQMYECF